MEAKIQFVVDVITITHGLQKKMSPSKGKDSFIPWLYLYTHRVKM